MIAAFAATARSRHCRHSIADDAIGNRLRQMNAADDRGLVQIGQRAGDLEDAVVAAGGEAHLFRGVAQELEAAGIGFGDLFDERHRGARIARHPAHAETGETVDLQGAGAGDAAGDGGARFSGHRADEVRGGDSGHVDADIDAVHQRAGDAGLVVAHAARAAGALAAGFARHAAAAGVHGGDELDGGGVADAMIGTRDDACTGFKRLAQRIERLRREFRQFVEEKHTIVGERGLAGSRPGAAADKGGHGGGVVRRAEGPAVRQAAAGQLAGDGMDHRDFEQLRRRERRQDGGEAGGEHGFSRTGRADHQQILLH